MASSALTKSPRSRQSCPPRFGTPRNPQRETLGPKVAEVAKRLGLDLMPWQRLVVDVAFEIDPTTGQLWYEEVDVGVPRQSGKTTLAMTVKTFRCARFSRTPQNVLYIAQSRNKAREKFVEEHVPILQRSALFAKAFELRLSNGSEHIKWRNGSRWGIDAPTRTAGHGATLDHVDIDEAFSQQDNRSEQALRPAMITRPSRQIWPYSTAGDGQSHYWWGKVESGRKAVLSGRQTRVAYFEWSAPDDADPGDPAVWWSTIPALGHTITESAIASEWERASLSGEAAVNLFRRAFLNQWVEIPQTGEDIGWSKIPAEAWTACRDSASALEPDARVSFAIDVTPDRRWGTIAVCGRRVDGVDHVEVVDHQQGTGWIVERIGELVERWPAVSVCIDKAGPAGSLWDDVGRAIPTDMLIAPTTSDVARAASSMLDAIVERSVAHRGQIELDSAARAAKERKLGESWAWARAGSSVPISPLVAVSLARWALRRTPEADAPNVWLMSLY